jgi:hypothetical protein
MAAALAAAANRILSQHVYRKPESVALNTLLRKLQATMKQSVHLGIIITLEIHTRIAFTYRILVKYEGSSININGVWRRMEGGYVENEQDAQLFRSEH